MVQLVWVVQVIGICRWRCPHYVTCSGSIQIQRGMLLAVFQQDSYTKTLMSLSSCPVQVVRVKSICRWRCPHYVTCSSQLLSVQVIAWRVQVKLTCTTPQVWCFVFNLVLFLYNFDVLQPALSWVFVSSSSGWSLIFVADESYVNESHHCVVCGALFSISWKYLKWFLKNLFWKNSFVTTD